MKKKLSASDKGYIQQNMHKCTAKEMAEFIKCSENTVKNFINRSANKNKMEDDKNKPIIDAMLANSGDDHHNHMVINEKASSLIDEEIASIIGRK